MIISKNASNKNWSELNFPQKTHRKHISIYPKSGASGPQRFAISEISLGKLAWKIEW